MKNITVNLKKLSSIIVLSGLLLASCSEYLDQAPQDSIGEPFYYQNPEQFTNAANFFYTRLFFDRTDTGYNGDESSDLSGNLSGNPLYGRGSTVTSARDDIWQDGYEDLSPVNQLIEKAAEYEGDQADIIESVATAYFFRAWHYYKLLKRFGGVPLATRSLNIDSEEVYAPRNSRYEVVFQILNDLDFAIANLPANSSLGADQLGKASSEAAKSFKARVLLYEATWEKYVGDVTDGDGTSVGAGSAKPEGYPNIQAMLTAAKEEAFEVIDGGAFELWDHRDDIGEDHLFYLFNLEEGSSNPAGLTKADNKEFIFQTVYDFNLRNLNQNISFAKPVGPTRKLMDMYLCNDGLPVQHSDVFEGYELMTSEFRNRDLRLVGFVKEPLEQYWGRGSSDNGGGAQFGVAFEDSGIDFDYRYVPQLESPGGARNMGYEGRKFVTVDINRPGNTQSYNYPQIRLAEVMLIYAETTAELGDGTISDADLNISINPIRERSGVAPLTNALIAPYSDLTMLGEIRRERAIELFGENFRFDDLKRWGIAVEELNRDVCSVYIEGTEFETAENPKSPGSPIFIADAWPLGLTQSEKDPSTYGGIAATEPGALIIDPASNRNWTIRNYLDPIPTDQINLNPELKQNPGW